jgi:hypothetical protein
MAPTPAKTSAFISPPVLDLMHELQADKIVDAFSRSG